LSEDLVQQIYLLFQDH